LLTGTVGGALAYQQTKDKYWLIGAALLAGKFRENSIDFFVFSFFVISWCSV